MRRRRKAARQPVPPPDVLQLHITRLDQPPPDAELAPASAAPESVCAARFRGHADALTFLAAVREHGARREPRVRRAPDGAIWVVVPAHRPSDIELTWALGGVAHLADGPDLVSPRGRRWRWRDVQAWPLVSWVELAAGVAPGTAVAEQRELVVVTTGSLARWIIDRCQPAALDLRVATVRLQALFRAGADDWSAVLIRVTAPDRAVPKAFVQALGGLPNTVVCRVGGRLLIDQRLRFPLPDAELATEVPEGQDWLLAGELGAWRLTERGEEYVPPLRVAQAWEPPPVPSAGRLPAELRVEARVVRDERSRATHALLLTDDELRRLRSFLTGHPAAERAFLVLGPNRHVYAEPGLGVTDIPFGVPLHRLGPGALYQEVGYRLTPALPAPARARLFAVDDQSLVVLLAGETHRLALRNTVPVWSLWLGPAPAADPAAAPLSTAALELLEKADAVDSRVAQPELATDGQPADRTGLYTEGFQLEQQGRLAEAARKYWEADRPDLAARLYELAAEADA